MITEDLGTWQVIEVEEIAEREGLFLMGSVQFRLTTVDDSFSHEFGTSEIITLEAIDPLVITAYWIDAEGKRQKASPSDILLLIERAREDLLERYR